MALTKIDANTIGIVQEVKIDEVKSRVAKRSEDIARYQAAIDAHTAHIAELQAQNDADQSIVDQAAVLGIGVEPVAEPIVP